MKNGMDVLNFELCKLIKMIFLEFNRLLFSELDRL